MGAPRLKPAHYRRIAPAINDQDCTGSRSAIVTRRRFYVCQPVRARCGVAGLVVARVRKIWRAM